jgi:hypothetical protein
MLQDGIPQAVQVIKTLVRVALWPLLRPRPAVAPIAAWRTVEVYVHAERGLAAEGVTTLQQMITRKATEVLGERSVKTAFFELPVTVEIAPGEQQVVVLTVYEESDPARLSAMFADKYKLPAGAASKLQLEVVRQMEKRTKIRVEVNLPDGSTRLLTVKVDETSKNAALRFGLEHGLTAQGIEALWVHLDRQIQLRAEAAAAVP